LTDFKGKNRGRSIHLWDELFLVFLFLSSIDSSEFTYYPFLDSRDIDEIMKKRSGRSVEMSRMFTLISGLMGLKSRLALDPKHAWNEVLIGGEWRLVDISILKEKWEWPEEKSEYDWVQARDVMARIELVSNLPTHPWVLDHLLRFKLRVMFILPKRGS
jgi:hypothetical protein